MKNKLKELQAQVVVLSEKINICSTLVVYPGCLDEIIQNGDLHKGGGSNWNKPVFGINLFWNKPVWGITRCRASKYMREKIMMQEVEIMICRTCSYKRG